MVRRDILLREEPVLRRQVVSQPLGLAFDEAEARKRPSRDAELPHRHWPDGSVGHY